MPQTRLARKQANRAMLGSLFHTDIITIILEHLNLQDGNHLFMTSKILYNMDVYKNIQIKSIHNYFEKAVRCQVDEIKSLKTHIVNHTNENTMDTDDLVQMVEEFTIEHYTLIKTIEHYMFLEELTDCYGKYSDILSTKAKYIKSIKDRYMM